MAGVGDAVVEELLAAPSVESMRSIVRRPDVGRRNLKDALSRRRQEASAAGDAAHVALLDFVTDEVDRLLPGAPDAPSGATSLEQVIDRAVQASSLLEVLSLLRRHEELLPADPYEGVAAWVVRERPDLRRSIEPLLAVLAIWRGDTTERFEGRLRWAARCRDAGNLDHALRHVKRAVAEAGPALAEMQRALALQLQGGLLRRQGKVEAAAEAFAAALRMIPDNRSVLRPPTRLAYASCLHAMNLREDVVVQLSAALSEVRDGIPDASGLVGRCTSLRGQAYMELGDYDEAAADFETAAQSFATVGDRHREWEARTNLALHELRRGRRAAGIAALRRLGRTVDEWGHSGMSAATHNNLGQALLPDQPIAALREFGKALARHGEGGNSRSAAIAWFGMGDAWTQLGHLDEAKVLYFMALVTDYGDEAGSWAIQCYLSRAADMLDDDSGANPMIQRELDKARGRGDLRALQIVGKAEAGRLLRVGDPGAAVDLYRSLLAEVSERGLEGPDVTRLRIGYADLIHRSGGREQDRFDALWSALQAVDERQARATLDVRRAEVVAEAVDLYDKLVNLLADNGGNLQLPDARTSVELAFDLHEAARSRTFAASLADTPLPRPPRLSYGLWAEESRLLAQERDLQGHLHIRRENPTRDRLDRLRDVRQRLNDVWEKMRPTAPDYVRLRTGEQLSLPEVQRLLRKADAGRQVTVVSYYCTSERTLCFVLGSEGTLRVYRADVGRHRLEDVGRRLRATFNGDPSGFPVTRAVPREAPGSRSIDFFTQLGGHLLPFTADVDEGTLLCIVPHGPLHLLPLHALSADGDGVLAARNPTVYAPSLSALAYTLRRRSIGSITRTALVAGVAHAGDRNPDILEHDEELFPQEWACETLRGTAASRDAVLARVGTHDVVHLTCHGYFDETEPMRSGLLLSDGLSRPPGSLSRLSRSERNTYVVSARDLAETSLTARLVTLRACSAAVQGRENLGDEFSGLVRSLLYAGAGAVVAALWNVDQQSSRDLLAVVYDRLGAGEPIWKALWLAQHALWEREDQPFLAHPYHWAPLVLFGDWR